MVAVIEFCMYTAGCVNDAAVILEASSCACSLRELSSLATVTPQFLILARVAADAIELEDAHGMEDPGDGRPESVRSERRGASATYRTIASP